ncbi:hypothetical protein HMPREF1650_07980, partial [Corynebacterium freneyi DNF00450]
MTCAVLASVGLGIAPATAAPAAPEERAVEPEPSTVVKHDYALNYSMLEMAMEPHVVDDDVVSKILGATPGPVHRRVDGVWFSSPTAPAEADRLPPP